MIPSRCAFRALLPGATPRSPDQFQMFSADGNQACVRALEFVLERPELVNLFGLNKPLLMSCNGPAPLI